MQNGSQRSYRKNSDILQLTSSILLPFLIIVGAIMALGLLARYNYSSETYMTPNEDIESHEKSAFGLTSISTAELRDCVAREISKESQTIHFVLEKILPCNNVVVERHGGFLVAVFSTSTSTIGYPSHELY